ALKVLARRLDESTRTRFVDAAHETAGLFHPNIVRFLGSGAFEDRPVIASEYIDGCSFAALLRRHPRERPPAWIVAVLFDALRALAAAHEWKERALIHGDLCPRDLLDRKSTRLNSSHVKISYAVFCLKKKNTRDQP